ncbi:MAG: FMN-binding glutamate synthase family protein [Candidatus Bathyarchaeia archaeon]|jgi:glutamate synthase domain-containing protein 2
MRKKLPDENLESYRKIEEINNIAEKGVSSIVSMGSKKKTPFSLDDLHFIPAQISKIPLNSDQQVNTALTIGKQVKKPLKASSRIIFSAISYGAVTKNVRLILTKVAAELDLAINTGEDIVVPEIELTAPNLIIQYSTVRLGINDDILKKCSAVEIRFGQGAYPGWRSVLPAAKVPPEIKKLRRLREGEDEYDLAHHLDIKNPKELAAKIKWLKELTGGVPVGAKIGCGNVEADVEVLADCGADFIALDGFGGGTGATELFARENLGLPIVAALPRADQHLRKIGKRRQVSLIVGGGLRTSSDFAKCLALGADAVYIGTSALIALGCQQYRVCHTGACPTGVTASNPNLLDLLKVNDGIRRLTNFVHVSNKEMADFTRMVGKDDVSKLCKDDLVALNRDLADVTGVKWLDGKSRSRFFVLGYFRKNGFKLPSWQTWELNFCGYFQLVGGFLQFFKHKAGVVFVF